MPLADIGVMIEGSGVVALAPGAARRRWNVEGGITSVDDAERPAGRAPARPRALSIAGSDSGGGAGIQADLKTFSVMGVYGMTAITAVTVQNTMGVASYEELSPQTVGDQIRAVVTDIGVDAAKTGMLASAAIVEAVAEAVSETRVPNLVVDPVAVSRHGDSLLAADAVDALRRTILPLATLVTPKQAGSLAGDQVETTDDMLRAADAILALGPRAVLVKGGHLEGRRLRGTCSPTARGASGSRRSGSTPRTHGTGCTLAAAITASLARGDDLPEAVRAGKAFVTQAIRHSLRLGEGVGPVDQLWSLGRDGVLDRSTSPEEDAVRSRPSPRPGPGP